MSHSKKEEDSSQALSSKWVACSLEEQYYGDSRKVFRAERKRLSAKDRSKYKKTDLDKYEKGIKKEIADKKNETLLARGRVLSITSQGFIVEYNGQLYTCFLRGLLKKQKTQHKNIVTVGDFVLFEELAGREGYIIEVEERKSILSRADNLSRRKEQLIAANIDQVLITVSVVSPPLKPHLIDRYIIAARKGGMAPVILINKTDLLESEKVEQHVRHEQLNLLKECEAAYRKAEIPLILLSAEKGTGIDGLKDVMKNKSSVFSGQSGAGKSSLINFVTHLNLSVGETVQKTGKGSHTTTCTHLVPLDFGGLCIDTPGIKSFGIWDLSEQEIVSYFAEIQEFSNECKYPNCSHTHELDCAIIRAFECGKISPIRYASYVSLIETMREEHKRR